MNDVRRTFLDTSAISADVLSSPEVARRWDEASALPEFTVRGLAGHLARATIAVEHYLDQAEGDGSDPISAAQYYSQAIEDPDIHSAFHQAIRERGEQTAAGGPDATAERLRSSRVRLEGRLEREPADRLVTVYKGLILRLDDYLVTR
ncbi:MAG: maleylpyruvate isomerase N-terminal domain-containing protein, partial [Actinomycetota bacterium]|nr:maleylpyruvate isomerase N-terminal domain-containing protein [Actinomycetota bacterium]